MYKLTIPCVSCYASGINEDGLKELVEGIQVKTWLTGTVSDVVAESLTIGAVANIPIFSRIRELNKQEMMAVYQCLEQNNKKLVCIKTSQIDGDRKGALQKAITSKMLATSFFANSVIKMLTLTLRYTL